MEKITKEAIWAKIRIPRTVFVPKPKDSGAGTHPGIVARNEAILAGVAAGKSWNQVAREVGVTVGIVSGQVRRHGKRQANG